MWWSKDFQRDRSVLGGGIKLPADEDGDDQEAGCHQHQRAREPAEIADRHEDRPEPGIEALAGKDVHVGRAVRRGIERVRLGLGDLGRRNGAEEDRRIVEQAVGPAELEEGIGEDAGQPDHLDLECDRRGLDLEGKGAEDAEHLLGGAEQRETAADGKDGGGGKECRAVLQPVEDRGIDHPQVALRRHPEPGPAMGVHALRQAGATERMPRLCGLRETGPESEKPENGEDVGNAHDALLARRAVGYQMRPPAPHTVNVLFTPVSQLWTAPMQHFGHLPGEVIGMVERSGNSMRAMRKTGPNSATFALAKTLPKD